VSARALWLLCVPLALLLWAAIVLLTAVVSPSLQAMALLVPLLALAVTVTLAPVVWLVASRIPVPGTGERPALALRFAGWLGLWVAACLVLVSLDVFSWMVAAALGAILTLVETYLLQIGRQKQGGPKPGRVRRIRAR
jgi:hypothetical protein